MTDATSIRQLAKAVGRSDTTVRKWLRRKDFPINREGPWPEDDIRELIVWSRVALSPDRSDPESRGRTGFEPLPDEQDKDYWLMRKYRAQALEQEGELLATQDVMRAWVQTTADIRDQMLMVPPAVQGLLALSDEQTEQLDDYLRRTLDGIADRMGDLADAARSVPISGEGDTATEADASERMGGDASVHAEEHDGGSGSVEE